ncbi:hypothetical protein M3M38_07230 [Fructilactobacillus cliffordii]|uniref:hypothetical protein n=1 Tax=Fructilactobacillus cliffordii TaxID=2940299 RepID=UPI002092F8B8|nr:hypothetical protein [Fructilactobacillus cliffordii]USS86451.1 hypothetical protein M3M38_07230 [Fructilactobacillus cliffordii]
MSYINNPFFSTDSNNITKINAQQNSISTLGVKVPSPNFCPFENIPSNFRYVSESYDYENLGPTSYRFEVTYQCQGCYKYVAVGYISNMDSGSVIDYDFNFTNNKIKFPFNEDVENNFPDFKIIYTQAQKAEKYGLNEIAGPGYRKAFENLIKEYLIKFCDKKEESIQKRSLSDCASDLGDETINKIAKVAIWVGNDQTHYDSNQNPNLDLNDLKNGINFTVNYLISEIEKKKLLQAYDDKKKD